MGNVGLDREKKWKIAFWAGCLIAGVATGLILYNWHLMLDLGVWAGSKWVLYFHPFPLSLFLTLMVWLYFRAFKGSAHYTGKGLKAYLVNLIPSIVCYGLALACGLELGATSPQDNLESFGMVSGFMLLLDGVALFFLSLQVVFAIRMFRSTANE